MANMFSNDARTFKFDVMVKLARDAYKGDINEEDIQGWQETLFRWAVQDTDAASIRKEKS